MWDCCIVTNCLDSPSVTSRVIPSPKLNVAFAIVPSGSFPSPEKRTENGADPVAAGLTVRLVQIGNWFGPDGVGVAEIVAVLVGVGIVVGIEVGPAPIGFVGLGTVVGRVVGVGDAAPGVVAAVEQVAL